MLLFHFELTAFPVLIGLKESEFKRHREIYPARLLSVEHFRRIYSLLLRIKIIVGESSFNDDEMQLGKGISIKLLAPYCFSARSWS